jgi:hypothetical protein
MLSLLLVLSQQMGIAHALSHWSGNGAGGGTAQAARAGERQVSASKSLALDQSCEQCLAFAQIGSALDTPVHCFPATRADAVAVIACAEQSCCRRTVCPFRSRAPPVLA